MGVLELHQRQRIIKMLLMHLNHVPADNASDIRHAIRSMLEEASRKSDSILALGAQILLASVATEGLDCFRVHPKGQGVVCMRPEGIREGTLVTRYVGNVCVSLKTQCALQQQQILMDFRRTYSRFVAFSGTLRGSGFKGRMQSKRFRNGSSTIQRRWTSTTSCLRSR